MNQKLIIAGCVGVILLTLVIPSAEQKVVFLDVGQGDSILFQNGSRQVLVDGGPSLNVLQRLGEELPWFDRHIEALVLSHPQADHLEGLVHILQRYEVGLVIFPRVASPTILEEKWLDLITKRNIPWRFAWAGQSLLVGDIKLQVLNPPVDNANSAAELDINNSSTILRADYHDLSFLLTGDAEKPIENKLVARYASDPPAQPRSEAAASATGDKGDGGGFSSSLDVDVLKAGHHGSKTSTTAGFLEAASPRAAVISVGADNKYGHPNQEVINRLQGIPLWRTDQNGSVSFIYINNRWHIKTTK